MVEVNEKSSSKERLLKATSQLLAERGYDGVGLALIAKSAKTTTGSLYFHFPTGKEALAVAAIEASAEGRRRRISEALRDGGPALIATMWADYLESSDWEVGCPVAATTLQMATRSEALRNAGHHAFQLWRGEIAHHLLERVKDQKTADVLSGQILAILEGAEMMSKTGRSRAPLEQAGSAIELLLKSLQTG